MLLFIIATILIALSYLAYRFVLPHRLTPLVVSHLLCLTWFVLYGQVLWSSEPPAGKFREILMIASGPFAYGINSWKNLLSPAFLTALTATVVGLCFRPNVITSHLIATGSTYWYVCGFILMMFAGLGT